MIRALLRASQDVNVYLERGIRSIRLNVGSRLKRHVLAKDERYRLVGKKPLNEEQFITSLLPNGLSLFVPDEEG